MFEGYLEGLRSAGWNGDRSSARFGYAAYAALKYGWLVFWLRGAADTRSYVTWERMFGRSMIEYVENQGRFVVYLPELADEARGC